MIIAPTATDAPIGVYIHVPFCAHICPYCDFNTYAGKQDLLPGYVDALEKEIALRAGEAGDRSAATIYLGGGTPSLLNPEQIARVLDAVRANLDVLPGAEITMEANPNGLSQELLAGYLQAGINRLSIGAQTLDRRGLRTLGRQHESTDVLARKRWIAVDFARSGDSTNQLMCWNPCRLPVQLASNASISISSLAIRDRLEKVGRTIFVN